MGTHLLPPLPSADSGHREPQGCSCQSCSPKLPCSSQGFGEQLCKVPGLARDTSSSWVPPSCTCSWSMKEGETHLLSSLSLTEPGTPQPLGQPGIAVVMSESHSPFPSLRGVIIRVCAFRQACWRWGILGWGGTFECQRGGGPKTEAGGILTCFRDSTLSCRCLPIVGCGLGAKGFTDTSAALATAPIHPIFKILDLPASKGM